MRLSLTDATVFMNVIAFSVVSDCSGRVVGNVGAQNVHHVAIDFHYPDVNGCRIDGVEDYAVQDCIKHFSGRTQWEQKAIGQGKDKPQRTYRSTPLTLSFLDHPKRHRYADSDF